MAKNKGNAAKHRYLKFQKNIKKRMHVFGFFLQNNNKMTHLMYSFMLLMDLVVVVILPMETVFDFQREERPTYMKYSLFQKMLEEGMLEYVTDGINIYLLLFLSLLATGYIKQSMKFGNFKPLINSPFKSVLSFLCIMTGRFLTPIFVCFQLIAVRCAFDSSHRCLAHPTSTARFITNCLGMIASVTCGYIQYNYQ